MKGMYNERIQVRKKDCAQVWKGHEYVPVFSTCMNAMYNERILVSKTKCTQFCMTELLVRWSQGR